MKPTYLFMLLLAAFTLTGCVTASYTADAGSEQFKMTSVFKSVDGLQTEKGNGQFNLKIDKTHTQDPIGNMVTLMQLMQTMQTMQVQPVEEE